jgi:ankyrin repeat protein
MREIMAFLDNLKTKLALKRKSDELIYDFVSNEMANGIRNEALWLKALELAYGNKEKQVAEYIKLRIQSLLDDMHLSNSIPLENSHFKNNHLDIENIISLIEKECTLEKFISNFHGATSEQILSAINQEDACNSYPIHTATKKNRIDIVSWLINSGAKVDAKNYWGKTALEITEMTKNKELRGLLEKHIHNKSLQQQSLRSLDSF